MSEITQEQINDALENCSWKVEIDGTEVCGGVVLPCLLAIKSGRCDTLTRLFHQNKGAKYAE